MSDGWLAEPRQKRAVDVEENFTLRCRSFRNARTTATVA